MRAVLGFAILFFASSLFYAGAYQSDGGFVGTDTCVKCHKLRDKALVAGTNTSPLTHALMPAGKDGAIEADFTNAPFKKEDVAWVLCYRRHEQNYLDKNLQVLPGTWHTDKKEWKERPSVDGAKECLGCHTVGFDAAKRTWTSAGVGCEACHGPLGAHAKSSLKVKPIKVGSLSVQRSAMVCGRCHSGGKAKDGSAFLSSFRPGADLDAVWVQDSGQLSSGRSQRYSEWLGSGHREKVPCVSCHDPHNTTGLHRMLRKPIQELCSECHKPQADQAKHAPTAKPDDTCASCHMPQASHKLPKLKQMRPSART